MPVNRIELPPADFFRAHLRYDPKTGLLYRKSNNRLATKPGTKYPRVSLMGVYYYAHRIIWKMEISDDVPHQIDHINENKSDSRLDNFRPATNGQNQFNKGKNKNNKSGYKGVCWDKSIGKWVAQIQFSKKKIHLGLYNDPAEAHAAFVKAAQKYHGEYANDGLGASR